MSGAKHKEVFEISDLRRREILHLRSVCPPGDGVLLYLHTYAGSDYFFGVQNSEFQYFFFFRKLNIFGVWRFCGKFFGVITIEDISMHFRVFSEGQGTEWRIFFGLLRFQIFIWGAWNSWYLFWVNGRCWTRAYICRKNESTPHPRGLSISSNLFL